MILEIVNIFYPIKQIEKSPKKLYYLQILHNAMWLDGRYLSKWPNLCYDNGWYPPAVTITHSLSITDNHLQARFVACCSQ